MSVIERRSQVMVHERHGRFVTVMLVSVEPGGGAQAWSEAIDARAACLVRANLQEANEDFTNLRDMLMQSGYVSGWVAWQRAMFAMRWHLTPPFEMRVATEDAAHAFEARGRR